VVVPTVIHELVRKPWLVWIASAGGVGSREGGCWWVQAGANVDAPAPAYLLIFLVLPVSCDPSPAHQVDTTLTIPCTASRSSVRVAEGAQSPTL
jgi:hypothetical protein